MEGFGRQKRYSKPFQTTLVDAAGVNPPVYDGRSFLSVQEITSYRSEQTGIPVESSEMDPYRDLLIANRQLKLDRNGQAGVDIDAGIDVFKPHRDYGHPVRNGKVEVTPTSPKSGWYRLQDYSKMLFSGPICASGAIISTSAASRMPFQFPGTNPRELRYVEDSFHSVLPPLQTDLDSFGKKGIVALAPGYPKTSLFAAAGELLVGFPKFIGHTLADNTLLRGPNGNVIRALVDNTTKASAEEYLNYVFGIVPTINDIANLIAEFNSTTETLLRIAQSSGHGVRRRMQFEIPSQLESFSEADLDFNGGMTAGPIFGSNFSSNTPFGGYTRSTLTMGVSREVRVSFSFSRFLPVTSGLLPAAQKFMQDWNLVLGSNPTPARIWELIPFSWLVDWFLQIQRSLDLLDKVSDDSLVINYGYVTGKTVMFARQNSVVAFLPAYASFSNVSTLYRSEMFERVRANPFGFIAPDSPEFTPLRIGILAALGLTRKSVN